ncbi:MAG TPA: amino acid permease [Solirubrobacteraceae bacterium]|nr:amino acid permease [Solirubrobacteraceae bacterium]
MVRRTLGSPALFAIVYSALASALFFSLGVVAKHALGLTPIVFLVSGLFFVLGAMTYVEGASLHQERGGSTVFARHAFNELWSFVAAWAILLDYTVLIAVCAFSATSYLAAFWDPLGHGGIEYAIAASIVILVGVSNVRGLTLGRMRRLNALVIADFALQVIVIVVGMVLVFNPDKLVDPIRLGHSPSWGQLLFGLTLTAVAFTGLESASGLAGEVRIGRAGLRRLVGASAATVMVVYVGIAVVAMSALPVDHGVSELSRGNNLEAPLLGVVHAYDHGWISDVLRYAVGVSAVLVLGAAANSAMLGLSRMGYSLATNRQIPSAVGRLHPSRATPYVLIAIAAALALALLAPLQLDFLIGIYAFGSMLAFTIAHLAICVLRYREGDRDRPYRMPGSVRIGGGDLPLPAVFGALLSAAGFVCVVVLRPEAGLVGFGWLVAGLLLYVIYRKRSGRSLLRRAMIAEEALRVEWSTPAEGEFGSILVPLTGGRLDEDLVQTAGRLAAGEGEDSASAVIEAVWIFQVPMSLPLDASLPETQLQNARRALARAKLVGEEYEGVEVATATVRARRAGEAIVDEARRRGVEAIVLAADEPSRVRGGALFGGGSLEQLVGDVTRYVIAKAPCRVILTAPPLDGHADGAPAGAVTRPRDGARGG